MKHQSGFTLIEILLVVFIIGMTVSVISLSIGGNAAINKLQKETEEFMLQASYIAEQSVLKGETHGLFVQMREVDTGEASIVEQWCYQWRRIRDQEWQDLPELPEQRCLPEGLVMEFVIDDKDWKYDPDIEFQDPVMGFYPSGDGSAEVEITLYATGQAAANDEQVQRITLDVVGQLKWVNEEERLAAEKEGK